MAIHIHIDSVVIDGAVIKGIKLSELQTTLVKELTWLMRNSKFASQIGDLGFHSDFIGRPMDAIKFLMTLATHFGYGNARTLVNLCPVGIEQEFSSKARTSSSSGDWIRQGDHCW